MTYKAVIFDFNGTLLWDTGYHNQAWDQFLDNHNIKLSDKEKSVKIHGKPNSDIFKGLFNGSLTSKEIEEMSQEKEQIYRNICSDIQLELAPGAREFIHFLKSVSVDYAIATSSCKGNVDFYLKKMNLSEWINPENIIYDDGSFKGKPHPDIFLKALQKIGHKAEDAVIFEDSLTGIKSAENANAGKIIIVDSNNDNYGYLTYSKIKNFTEVDKSLFIK
ncbi:MAG: HAD family phosphatase [Chloroflexia bacterium]|nr:HAD family phosphatase [Chloroflexia bacterium]